MLVYRLYKSTYITDPFSAEGARRAGGRRNPKGYPVLYTSATPELALLEVLVHLDPRYIPAFHLLVLEIPQPIQVVTLSDLPQDWLTEEAYERTQTHLLDWLRSPTELAVAVPSGIVTRSQNVLLHTQHSEFNEQVRIVEDELFGIDPRLLGGQF
jgi:RES domain-containing protein